jgi:ABC-2 type transport system ATP-binding protein
VLLSSHILSEVERLADRVTIIREGRTVETGSLESLRHLRRTRVSAVLKGPAPDLTSIPGVHELRLDSDRVTASVDPEGLPPLLVALSAAGIESLTSAPPSLEELFLDAYRAPSAAAT